MVAHVGGMLHLTNNPRLTSVTFSEVSHGLEVRGNHALPALSFHAPEQIDGTVQIENNAILNAAPFEGLKRIIGYVYIWSNPSLKTVFSTLEEVSGDLNFHADDAFTIMQLPSLQRTGGLTLTSCASVTELDMPALARLTVFGISLVDNAALRHIRLPLVRSADPFWVFDNHSLPACEVTALFAAVQGSNQQQFGNDETAECAP